MEVLIGFILSVIVVSTVASLLVIKTSNITKLTKDEISISNRKYAVRILYSGLDSILVLIPFTIHNMWDKYTVRIYVVLAVYSMLSIAISILYLKSKKDYNCKIFDYIRKFRRKNILLRHSVLIVIVLCYVMYLVIN